MTTRLALEQQDALQALTASDSPVVLHVPHGTGKSSASSQDFKPFDNYEISPCVRLNDEGQPDPNGNTFEACEPHEAHCWTLYGHIPGEGVEAIGDFASREDAEETFQRITGIPFGSHDGVEARVRVMHAAGVLLEAASIAEQLCRLVTRWADAEGDEALAIMDDIVAIAQDESLPAHAILAAIVKEAA